MTYSEFRRQLGKAGLTIREFADLVGMSRVTISNYSAKGYVPRHLAIIASLMAEMAEYQIQFGPVVESALKSSAEHRQIPEEIRSV